MDSSAGSTTQEASPSEPVSSSLPMRRATASAISRKTHRKSRNGCYNCKRRKIKCDEGHPSCRNCVKHAVECDFTTRRPPSVHDGNPGADSSLHLLDLELLHNFTSSTYATLTNDPTLRKVWKTAVMRRAVSCDFVMRTILAVSGVHIAQYRPQQRRRYVSCALTHHQLASQTAIDLLSDPLPEQREDLWLFSVLTIYYALGSPKEQASASLIIGESVLPDWILLLNGVGHLLSSMQATTYSGTLSPIVKQGQACFDKSHQPEHENSNILDELAERVRKSVTDLGELAIHEEAIRELRCQLSLVLSTERQSLDIIDAFLWQFSMSERFMPLVQQTNQVAVAIFAHSLIIHNALSYHKWLHGWDTILLSWVWDILDEEHRDWIQWPIEEIGWVPPPLTRAELF